jgi:dUTP pyrophosphatase
MRKFEKISFDQFKKDIADDKELYDSYEIPSRDTYYAAGYDFHALTDFVIHPGEIKKIPTGIKASMEDDEVLLLMVRSSQGFRFNIRLINQVGVVDKDYYNNPTNEGHIYIGLQNEGEKDYEVKKGEGFGQGLFMKYLLTEDDQLNSKITRNDDDNYLKDN